jgi:anti-sigma factor RsiW
MITCREFIEFLLSYLSNELPPAQHAAFDFHLSDCPDCLSYLQSYQATVLLEQQTFSDPNDLIPADVPEALVQAVLAAIKEEP